MLEVRFYEEIDDTLLQFAVIVSRYKGKWVFCKHKERTTYECPGGHREPGEAIEAAARRELYEETGAAAFSLTRLCAYGVSSGSKETFGMLYYAEITALDALPEAFEMEKILLTDTLPESWTYPEIQPKLMQKVMETIK